MMIRVVVACGLSLLSALPMRAATRRATPGVLEATAAVICRASLMDSLNVEKRAAQIAALLGLESTAKSPGSAVAGPPAFDTIFASAFLAQVPPARITALVEQLRHQYGPVAGTARSATLSADGARYLFTTSRGFAYPVTVHVDSSPPFLVDGLLFGSPTKLLADLDDVTRELAVLHGQVSFIIARLGAKATAGFTTVAALHQDRVLALGSAFKLYVLGELVHSVEAGERHWTDVVSLDSALRSLPSGVLQSWPAGTAVTLQTLATLMISQSDNTAADQLLHALGRERVERNLSLMGLAAPERNVPFLSTREMFALKSPAGAAFLQRFEAGSLAERRRVVSDIGKVPYQQLAPYPSGRPVAVDSIEWFASGTDLVRTMRWLRDNTEREPGVPARAILAVNPGLQLSAERWPYIGFKGGSEPGVLNMTFLLRARDGQWYVVATTWNDPAQAVDQSALLPLVTRAIELIPSSPAAP